LAKSQKTAFSTNRIQTQQTVDIVILKQMRR